jgi:ArsR family transcriptional regulator
MDRLEKQKYMVRAEIFKALANPTRLAIVDYLTEGEKCVCNIVEYLGEKQSSVSRHLSTLRNAGIVETRKEGLNIYYRLKTPCIKSFFGCIDNVIREQHEEIEKLVKRL